MQCLCILYRVFYGDYERICMRKIGIYAIWTSIILLCWYIRIRFIPIGEDLSPGETLTKATGVIAIFCLLIFGMISSKVLNRKT